MVAIIHLIKTNLDQNKRWLLLFPRAYRATHLRTPDAAREH